MIKTVGATPIQPKHRASCHCGAVVMELDLPDGVVDPGRCDCSLCRPRPLARPMLGAVRHS
jgi:hypothetical protein